MSSGFTSSQVINVEAMDRFIRQLHADQRPSVVQTAQGPDPDLLLPATPDGISYTPKTGIDESLRAANQTYQRMGYIPAGWIKCGCRSCKQPIKPATHEFFTTDNKRPNKLQSWCRACKNEWRVGNQSSDSQGDSTPMTPAQPFAVVGGALSVELAGSPAPAPQDRPPIVDMPDPTLPADKAYGSDLIRELREGATVFGKIGRVMNEALVVLEQQGTAVNSAQKAQALEAENANLRAINTKLEQENVALSNATQSLAADVQKANDRANVAEARLATVQRALNTGQ